MHLSLHNEFIVHSMSVVDPGLLSIIQSILLIRIPPSPPSSTRCSGCCSAAVRRRLLALSTARSTMMTEVVEAVVHCVSEPSLP